MTQIISTNISLEHLPPWHLDGDAFILNYWVSPSFIRAAQDFRLAPSPIGRVVQVLLVRYKHSPVGPYDELLILDHPLMSKRRLSSIPKIYVSTQISVDHGQALWGIPKELAKFEWQQHAQEIVCSIKVQQHEMRIRLTKTRRLRSFYINSHHLPASLLEIRQAWQGRRYQFSPQFRGHLSKLINAEWENTHALFPDFSQARYLQSFYVPQFHLVFPEASIQTK
ncbi:acetoacetate decarboxylase family protein [Acinetobacter gandensis]|uniref:acetoacetate decarboxylase family protein n=1 Tax=Acinetobacter gandensis TaxID=1443941 RepID=UPI00398A09CE